MGGLVAVILFIFGFWIGGMIKSILKFIIIFGVLIASLYMFGALGKDVLMNMKDVFELFKPLFSAKLTSMMGDNAMSVSTGAFMVGLAFGFMKG